MHRLVRSFQHVGPFLSFAPQTPVATFVKDVDDIATHDDRLQVAVTGSSLADALGVKGSYQSRKAFTQTRFFGTEEKPPSEFCRSLMAQGKQMEPFTFALVDFAMRRRSFDVLPSGFLLDREMPWALGATPDGLIFDAAKKEFAGVLELKYRANQELSRERTDIPDRYIIQILAQTMCTTSNRFWYAEMKGAQCVLWEGEFHPDAQTKIRIMLKDYLSLVERFIDDQVAFPQRAKLWRFWGNDEWEPLLLKLQPICYIHR